MGTELAILKYLWNYRFTRWWRKVSGTGLYALRCLRISNPWSTHLSQSALPEGAAGGCSLGGSQSIGHQSGSWVSASGEDSVNIKCEACRVALFFVLGRNIMTSHDISWNLKQIIAARWGSKLQFGFKSRETWNICRYIHYNFHYEPDWIHL